MEFHTSLECLMNDLTEYFLEVEMADLPALDRVLTAKESKILASSFTRAKMFVPSRSHLTPWSMQYFAGIFAWIAAPIDSLSNLFRKFPDGGAAGECSGRVD